jgi:RND family efflux transporter MFP subunit
MKSKIHEHRKNNFTLVSKKTIILLLIAFPVFYACKEGGKENNPFEAANIIPIKTATVSSLQLTNNINTTGLVTTENDAKYSFKIGGVIHRIFVEEGESFKKGQLLATLDVTEITAGLTQTSLNVEKSERDYSRAYNLYKDSVYTLEQLQNTKTALDIAKKQKEVVAFNARHAKIFATSDGFVSRKIASEGEVIGVGSPVLIINETTKGNDYILKVGLTDKEWTVVKLGQKALVMLDGYPEKQFDALVFRKSKASDFALGSFQVELRLDMKGIEPAIGMFGKAEIYTDKAEDVMAIPYEALIEADGNKASVFTVSENNKVKRMLVEILRFENEKVYIKDGLQKTDRIVVSNSAYLNERSKIKIIE